MKAVINAILNRIRKPEHMTSVTRSLRPTFALTLPGYTWTVLGTTATSRRRESATSRSHSSKTSTRSRTRSCWWRVASSWVPSWCSHCYIRCTTSRRRGWRASVRWAWWSSPPRTKSSTFFSTLRYWDCRSKILNRLQVTPPIKKVVMFMKLIN